MSTEAIVCPTCRAADTSKADGNQIHTCVYCGARYRLKAEKAVAVQGPASARKRQLGAIFALGALLAAAILGRFLFVTPRGATAPRISLTKADLPPSVRNPTAVARPAPDAPPEAPPTATFAFSARATGYQTSFYVLGWVTNTSPYVIDKPKVVAVLVDAAGSEVGTAQGFVSVSDLGPGEKAPIKILVNKPPPFAAIKYEPVARKATYRSPRASGLRVEPAPPKRSSFGSSWDLSGKVFHEGTEPAKFIRVTTLAFDAQGTLIGLHETFAQGAAEVLKPGESARFLAPAAFADTTPAKFEYLVDAMAVKN